MVKRRKAFLKHMGGQKNVQCGENHLPLTSSTERSNKCQCGRQEYLRCCAFDCKVYLCKKYFERNNENHDTIINYQKNYNYHNNDGDGLEEPHSDHNKVIIEVPDENDDDNNEVLVGDNDDCNIIDKYDFDIFLTSTLDPDVYLEGDEQHGDDDNEFFFR